LYSKEDLLDQIAVILGGRCAEIEFFERSTTGASDDLQRAREVAFNIVTTYGMSEKMKFVRFKYDEFGNKIFSENTQKVT
jgi:ATP-dependent Zn protease